MKLIILDHHKPSFKIGEHRAFEQIDYIPVPVIPANYTTEQITDIAADILQQLESYPEDSRVYLGQTLDESLKLLLAQSINKKIVVPVYRITGQRPYTIFVGWRELNCVKRV